MSRRRLSQRVMHRHVVGPTHPTIPRSLNFPAMRGQRLGNPKPEPSQRKGCPLPPPGKEIPSMLTTGSAQKLVDVIITSSAFTRS